jgi:hypothetical protein
MRKDNIVEYRISSQEEWRQEDVKQIREDLKDAEFRSEEINNLAYEYVYKGKYLKVQKGIKIGEMLRIIEAFLVSAERIEKLKKI